MCVVCGVVCGVWCGVWHVAPPVVTCCVLTPRQCGVWRGYVVGDGACVCDVCTRRALVGGGVTTWSAVGERAAPRTYNALIVSSSLRALSWVNVRRVSEESSQTRARSL